MYKILVIDDEKSIVKGLVKVLESREELELQVYYAYTVSEGLKIAKEIFYVQTSICPSWMALNLAKVLGNIGRSVK